MAIINKYIIEKLSGNDITKREYDSIISEINEAVDDIWRYIIKVSNRKIEWWAFQNDVELGNGNGSTGGEFDPVEDREFITIIGEFSTHKSDLYKYNDGFPTSFLWTDDDYTKIVLDHLKSVDVRSEALKQAKTIKTNEQLIQSIKNKLTPEELKLISFKK